ncbi:hypothetical protein TPHA_0G00930 [Tetrapisispora phaffii CBS 4417]|uniref:SH3 domain-containing protein n=1 Tax=Tetrapisispora phaffii (strain ATCC 24235 / CBS 4417 / NBRC 1672 / NRRL Y-8282 / UCD 70-5) TaxID=1071381 RepID=G8BVK1_TETPH|nr:hypothetical protein TPHA_0G00930 [Tetrapisispora phaffii CBS 4417]CCE63929.1 hypothetical protein TPHA_0G00930 [Tetrapisispora phaffii CBS 4417]
MSVAFMVKARYGWSGQAKGDLGFLEGDIMNVTKTTGDWYYGFLLRNKKSKGYFPKNFVIELNGKTKPSVEAITADAKLPNIPSRSKYEASQSSPNLPSLIKSNGSSNLYSQSSTPNNNSSYRKQSSSGYNNKAKYQALRNLPNKETFPALPQIPVSKSNSDSRYKLMKSHSENDIPVRDYNYYKDNSNFYDGYMPSNIRSSCTSSFVTDDSSNTNLFSNSKYLDSSLVSSENSFALMSDFSATSAGSFMRHKYAQSFEASSLDKSEVDVNNDSFSGKAGGFLNKIFLRNGNGSVDSPKLPDLTNMSINNENDNDAKDWLVVNKHLNRSKTLTKYEKHPRYMRALEEHRDIVLHPQDYIYNGLNTNEVVYDSNDRCFKGSIDIELKNINMQYLDKMTRQRCDKSSIPPNVRLDMWCKTTFSARYQTTLEKLRGIYIFCTEMFELIDDHGATDFNREPVNIDTLLTGKYCTPYQLTWLFKKLANCLGIRTEVVLGFLKTPMSNNSEFKYNHCWLRILVNKEWRFIDVILGNITNPIHEFVNKKKTTRADNFYFLTEPLNLIYTHIPARDYEQHIVPSVDQLSALYLPLVFPSFFKNDIKLYKFSTALSFLEDSEIYECSLEIPSDIELYATVVTPGENSSNKSYVLSQVRKLKPESNRKIAVIKAVLPPGAKAGDIYVHSGLKSSRISNQNAHQLSLIIPLSHKGASMDYEFVKLTGNENIKKIDQYIVEPQNKFIYQNTEYNFEIFQHPYDNVIYNNKSLSKNGKQPLIVKSPSGKIYELKNNDQNSPFGTWRRKIKVKESGTWRGLMLSDSSSNWFTFAEWTCL